MTVRGFSYTSIELIAICYGYYHDSNGRECTRIVHGAMYAIAAKGAAVDSDICSPSNKSCCWIHRAAFLPYNFSPLLSPPLSPKDSEPVINQINLRQRAAILVLLISPRISC